LWAYSIVGGNGGVLEPVHEEFRQVYDDHRGDQIGVRFPEYMQSIGTESRDKQAVRSLHNIEEKNPRDIY
jgi:hypothetical protein